MLAAEHHAPRVDRHRAVPDLDVERLDPFVRSDARLPKRRSVVVEHVEPPESIERGGDERLHVGLERHVRAHCEGASPARLDLPGHRPRAGLVDVPDRDRRPLRGEALRLSEGGLEGSAVILDADGRRGRPPPQAETPRRMPPGGRKQGAGGLLADYSPQWSLPRRLS